MWWLKGKTERTNLSYLCSRLDAKMWTFLFFWWHSCISLSVKVLPDITHKIHHLQIIYKFSYTYIFNGDHNIPELIFNMFLKLEPGSMTQWQSTRLALWKPKFYSLTIPFHIINRNLWLWSCGLWWDSK